MEPAGRDVLAQISGRDLVAKVCEVLKQLNGYQMDLAEVWSARIAASEVSMAHMGSCMCIAFYPVSCNEVDHFAR